jgi:hypothetical protein
LIKLLIFYFRKWDSSSLLEIYVINWNLAYLNFRTAVQKQNCYSVQHQYCWPSTQLVSRRFSNVSNKYENLCYLNKLFTNIKYVLRYKFKYVNAIHCEGAKLNSVHCYCLLLHKKYKKYKPCGIITELNKKLVDSILLINY